MFELLAKISDPVGILGVILLLVAYCLLSTNKMSPHSITYQVLNFVGAALILFSLLFHWNTASVLIEIAWMIISVIGLYRIIRTREREKAKSNLYLMTSKR